MRNSIFGGILLVALPLLTLIPGCGGGAGSNIGGGIATPTPTGSPLPTVTPTSTPIGGASALFSEAFLVDNNGQPANDFNGFLQWNVTDGTVDLVGGTVSGANDETNGRFVDLDGGNSGLFATKNQLNFQVGTTYNLSFTYKSTNASFNTVSAKIAGQTFNVTTSSTATQTFSQNFFVNSATQTLLTFQDLGNDDAGIGIDNIVVSVVTNP